MGGKQNDRNFALVFDFAQKSKHFWIYIHFFINSLKDFMESPSHESDYRHSEFPNKLIRNLLTFFYDNSLLLFKISGAAF